MARDIVHLKNRPYWWPTNNPYASFKACHGTGRGQAWAEANEACWRAFCEWVDVASDYELRVLKRHLMRVA